MKNNSRIALNVASKWGTNLLQAILGLILVPFLLIQLGKDGYGIIGIVGVIVSTTQFVDLGLRAGLSRHLMAARAKENEQRFNQLISTSVITYMVMGILLSLLLIFTGSFLLPVFKIPDNLKSEGLFLIRYYAAWKVFLSFVYPPYSAILLSHNRFDITNWISGAAGLLRCVLLLIILYITDWGLYGYAMAEIGAQVIGLLAIRNTALHYHPTVRINLKLYSWSALRQMFSLGSKMTIFNIARFISMRADPIILTTFLGPSAVALYKPAVRLSEIASEFVNALRSQLWTLATDAYETNHSKNLLKILISGTKYTVMMGSIASAFLIVYAMPIMEIWIGSTPLGEHFTTCAWVLVCWTVAQFFDYLGGTQWSVLYGMDRLNFLVYIMSCFALINILFSLFLVGYTDLGVLGVVVPTALISIIRRPIILLYCSRQAGIKPWRYIQKAYTGPLAVFSLTIVSAILLRMVLSITSIWSLLVSAVTLCLIWAAGCWWIGFEESDRVLFRLFVLKFFN